MPAVNETYTLGFKADSGTDWLINISDIAPTATAVQDGEGDYSLVANDFKLRYTDQSEGVFDHIKTSSLSFPAVIFDSSDEAIIEDIFTTNYDVNWYVSLWKNNVLYWWGYLSPLTAKRPNESYPFDYKLEAVDTLALLKDVNIWDKTYFNKVPLPGLGTSIKIPLFRFGAPRDNGVTSNTLYPRQWPTVIEAVYSLLYDIDPDVTGNLYEAIWWEATSKVAGVGALNSTSVNIWYNLFSDMPANTTGGIPLDLNYSANAYDILRSLCEMFCFRIFQKGGDYYVVQPEMYQAGANVTRYKYVSNPTATGSHPINGGSSTLTTSDYLTTITSPPTANPRILEGSEWDKLNGLHTVSLLGSLSKSGVGDYMVKQSIDTSTNNLSDLSAVSQGITSEWGDLEIVYRSNKPTALPQMWLRSPSLQARRTYPTCVRARMETRNKFRYTFEGVLFTPDYDFLKGISYDGKTYIPHSLNLTANDDHYQGEWVEMRLDTGDLKEPELEAVDKGKMWQNLVIWYFQQIFKNMRKP